MGKIGKVLKLNIVLLTISALLLYTSPVSGKDALRVPIDEKTTDRITEKTIALIEKHYDRIPEYYSHPRTMEAIKSIFSKVIPTGFIKDKWILDLGIGQAIISMMAAEFSPKGIIGIDISENILKEAEKNLSDFADVETKLIKGNFMDLEKVLQKEKIKKFDIIFLGNTLIHWPDEYKKIILSKISPFLKNKGYLIIIDKDFNNKILSEIFSKNIYSMSAEKYKKIIEDLGFKEHGSYTANIESDEDWGFIGGDLEVHVAENFVVWARKIESVASNVTIGIQNFFNTPHADRSNI